MNKTPPVSEKMRQSMGEEGAVRDTDIGWKHFHSQCTWEQWVGAEGHVGRTSE